MSEVPKDITEPVPSVDTLCSILQECARVIIDADGDRDYMNPSNLTVRQTTAIADYINMAIARLDSLS